METNAKFFFWHGTNPCARHWQQKSLQKGTWDVAGQPRGIFLPFQIMDIILSDFWKGVKLVLFYKWVSDLTPVQAKEVLGA